MEARTEIMVYAYKIRRESGHLKRLLYQVTGYTAGVECLVALAELRDVLAAEYTRIRDARNDLG